MSPPATAAPKRRNAIETKVRILASAQNLFAANGYAQTVMRDIAADAGVAVSLVAQHFGSKAELFEAALIDAMETNTIFAGPREKFGRSLVDYALSGADLRLPAMVILSTGDDDAREITARVTRERIITGLAAQLGPPNARDRAMELTMLSTGFLIYARQIPVGEISERTKNRFAQWLQAIIDGT
jgi:AcrR family transcriptional regulator